MNSICLQCIEFKKWTPGRIALALVKTNRDPFNKQINSLGVLTRHTSKILTVQFTFNL